MSIRKAAKAAKSGASPAPAPAAGRVRALLAELERLGSARNREGMARYGIVATRVFGVSVATLRGIAKRIGRDHELAAALWASGWYEARLLAAFVDEPGRVTPAQMDRWARDFENWADCDTVCFHLFDKTPHAFGRVDRWAQRQGEFVRRAAFALLASLALHAKQAPGEEFRRRLALVERASGDGRNFVKKAVSWALRSIGHRADLRAAALATARRLARSDIASARWIGRDALRDLERGESRPALGGSDRGPRSLSVRRRAR
ncbi:MAG: DNA alkylation repair protein [Thermoanaerobaculia bacterium]